MKLTLQARSTVDDKVMAEESISGTYKILDGGVLEVTQERGRTTVYAPGAWFSIEHD